MSEEFEEIPPYEEWLVKDLRAELSFRKLNNAGTKAELVSRLNMDDELGVDEVEEDPDDEDAETVETDSTSSEAEQGWVIKDTFYLEFVEDIGRDDFNTLPTNDGHHKMLLDTFYAASKVSDRTVSGGPFGAHLRDKTLKGNKIVYTYSMALRPA